MPGSFFYRARILRLEQATIAFIEWIIRRPWVISPQPPQHLRHHRSTLTVGVRPDSPTIIQVVSLLGESSNHFAVLLIPVPLRVVATSSSSSPIVIQAILKKDPYGFFGMLSNQFRVDVAAPNVRETPDGGEDLAKSIRPMPGHGKGTDGA